MIVLGVCGGIAAYRAAELARLLVRAGHDVTPVLTHGAERFVSRLTFEALTGQPVHVSEWELAGTGAVGAHHVRLARAADAIVVAPASAHTLAKLAHGLTDDLLTAVALAADPQATPLVLAPAMNAQMYAHPATRDNLALLVARGARVVAPGRGDLEGSAGPGRMAEPADIAAALDAALGAGDLAGVTVLVSAGGTREPIDGVRDVGNRSSGRMGFAVAAAAARRGASVTLLVAHVTAPVPDGMAAVVSTPTAAALLAEATRRAPSADVVVMAAAVADFRPAEVVAGKLDKRDGLVLTLEPTADVLAALAAARRDGQVLVGFAAEADPSAGLDRARAKRERKSVDLIVYNDVSRDDVGFDADHNEVVLVAADGERAVGRRPKAAVAEAVLDEVVRLRLGQASRAPA